MSTTFPADWAKMQQVSMAMPAMMANNFCNQIVEMQQHIATREEGNHFPDVQETNVLCKLVNCVEKLKKYPTASMSMQAIGNFIHFISAHDADTADYLSHMLNEYITRQGNDNFKPFDLEYDVDPVKITPEKTSAANSNTTTHANDHTTFAPPQQKINSNNTVTATAGKAETKFTTSSSSYKKPKRSVVQSHNKKQNNIRQVVNPVAA